MDELRRVLVIGVQHDHNVSTNLESLVVTGLLITAIAFILLMADDVVNAQFLPYVNGTVAAGIVNQDHFIYNFERNFFVGLA